MGNILRVWAALWAIGAAQTVRADTQPVDPYGPPGQSAPLPVAHDPKDAAEVMGAFAAVGGLAGVDILLRQDVTNTGNGALILFASTAGGGGIGYLLTEKYPITAGAAHATTLGLMVGAANGALLIKPTGIDSSEGVVGLMLLGSAAGTVAGFVYGQHAKLTAGQSWFVGNATLLGSATAALGAITGSRNSQYDNWENGTLAVGLDAGVVTGALLAPRLDWSARRGKVVFASTTVGALVGGMLAGLTTRRHDSGGTSDPNPDVVTACMTAGLWGGFGLGILMTGNFAPDPSRAPAASGVTQATYAPWLGAQGERGIMAGGTW